MHGIARWIDKRAEITPERIALIGEERRLSYLEMSQEVNRFARLLADRYQLKRGERVGILAANSIEYLLLLFAIAKLGCIAVVLNIRLTPRELEFQASDSGMRLLIAEESFAQAVEQFSTKAGVERVLWMERLKTAAAGCSAERLDDDSAGGDIPFIICYTSGTTGRPKGAVLTQANMFWNAVNNCLAIDITSNDRVLTLLPLFHIGGIGLFAFPALFAGGTVVVPRRFDPEQALRMIEAHKISIVMGVPTMHDLIRRSLNFHETDFRSVRWFYSGGAPCPRELISFYLERGITFGQGYGMTETAPTVFMTSREDCAKKPGSIGKPVMFCDIRIVDEHGRDVAAGEVGELLVKGDNVMKEYWNLPEATAAAIREGWLATGDLVTRDEEGFVTIVGRKKEMVISGGENIYPLEVEQVIAELPAVAEVAVLDVPDPKWGEVGCRDRGQSGHGTG